MLARADVRADSTIDVGDACACVSQMAHWNGTVRIVPSLKAPGFCNAETTGWFTHFNDASAYTHLVMMVRTDTPGYAGFKVSFAADTLNPQFQSFKTEFAVPESESGKWTTVAVPFRNFSNDWSSFTGRCDTKDPAPFHTQHHCCGPEHPEVCPTAKNLHDMEQMGLWTEGVAGDFTLDVMWIGAGNMTSVDEDGNNNDDQRFSCPIPGVQHNLRFNVSGRKAANYLPNGAEPGESLAQAVCCDKVFAQFAEPNDFFLRPDVGLFDHIDAATTTTFYDSACGKAVFTAPQNRSFEAWRNESEANGWPSFRMAELHTENVVINQADGSVVSVCGTHLGSVFHDADGPRYCIDLSCISGHDDSDTATDEAIVDDAEVKMIATFDGAAGTTFPWVAVNDPVMGGQSSGNVSIDSTRGVADWQGDVKIVPFLHAPGFCNVQSPGLGKTEQLPDVSGFDGISIDATNLGTSSESLTQFNVRIYTEGAKKGWLTANYVGNFTLPMASGSSLRGAEPTTPTKAFVPWSAFKCSWRGQPQNWCPALDTQLAQMNGIGLGTAFPGRAGPFHIEMTAISASRAPSDDV